jgi:hypothetical protein
MLGATIFAASAIAWVACTSFDDAPATDATDAASDMAASPDTTAGGDAGCTAFFCDDFERTTTPGDGWNEVSTPKAAGLSLSPLHARSGAGSLELTLFTDGGTGPRTAFLSKDLHPTATRAVVDFWLHYEQAPSTDTTVVAIGLHTLDGNIIALLRDEGSFVLNEQWRPEGGSALTNGTSMNVGTIKIGATRHVILEVGTTLDDGGPGARLTVDGESKVYPLLNKDPRPRRVFIGSTFSAQGTRDEDKFWYDDVVIEAPAP